MSVRDRFDPGGAAAVQVQGWRARQVQEGTQNECANQALVAACRAVQAGDACAFALDLAATWYAMRGIVPERAR